MNLAEKKLGAKHNLSKYLNFNGLGRRDQPSQQEHEQHVGVCALLLLWLLPHPKLASK